MKTNPDLIKVMMQDLGIMTPEEHEKERREYLSLRLQREVSELEYPPEELPEREEIKIPA